MKNFGYLFKEGIRGIFKHGFMSFAAVCVTVACLLIVGVFSSLIYNLILIVDDLNKTNEVIAYVEDDLDEQEAMSISSQFQSIDGIYDAKFVTREEAFEEFKKSYDNDSGALSGFDSSDLPDRYKIVLDEGADLDTMVALIDEVPGIKEVSAEKELAEGFATMQNILNIVSVSVILILLGVSLLIISNTVKIAMYDRKEEIAIMKMVGATNGFIRTPFVVEGFTLGILGAALAFGLEWLLYDAMMASLIKEDTLHFLTNSFVPFSQLILPMAIVFGLAGLFVGVVGSWFSIRKFMDV